MNASTLSLILSGAAVLISAGLLWVHRSNQVERRHGELIQLRGQMVSDLRLLHQRLSSQLVNAELIRAELRRLPDSDDKYRSIEEFPTIVDSAKQLKTNVEKFLDRFEKLTMAKFNRSDVLLALQQGSEGFKRDVMRAQELDDKLLALLAKVRVEVEA